MSDYSAGGKYRPRHRDVNMFQQEEEKKSPLRDGARLVILQQNTSDPQSDVQTVYTQTAEAHVQDDVDD